MSFRNNHVQAVHKARHLSFLEHLEPRWVFSVTPLPLEPHPLPALSDLELSQGRSAASLHGMSENTSGSVHWSGSARHSGFDTSVLNVPWAKERESVARGASNDTIATAQYLRNLGTLPGDDSEVNILGSLGVTAREIRTREDDGSIQHANPTGLRAGQVGAVIARARLGDGPHGSAGTGTGDYDYYKFAAKAGQLVSVNVESDSLYNRFLSTTFPKNLVAAIYDSAGNLLTYNDDLTYFGNYYALYGQTDPTKGHFDPGFRYQIGGDGEYYVAVFSAFDTQGLPAFQSSPFDSASGGGVGSEGDYTVSITLESPTTGSNVGEPTEDGAIPFAIDTGIEQGGDGFGYFQGYIGDGLYGSAGTGSGDFDMYRFDATAGARISISADADPRFTNRFTFDELGNLFALGMDTKITLYDATGTPLFYSDDFQDFDGAIEFTAFYTGTYYVAVSGYSGGLNAGTPDQQAEYYSRNFLANPFDPASGGGAGTEGAYGLLIKTQTVPEIDMYSLDLRPGDILSVAGVGAVGKIGLLDPGGQPLHQVYDMQSYYQRDNNPLYVGLGDASFERVITEAGRYTLTLTEASLPGDTAYPYMTPASPYNLNVRVFRPGLESQPVFTHQVLYLDFDGAPADSLYYNSFFTPDTTQPTVTNLSPMRAYLEQYGFSLSDENAMIDRILAYVTDRLATDVGGAVGRGLNGEFLVTDHAGDFQIEILNSRDNPDYYMQYPNVSRILVGSSLAEVNSLEVPYFAGISNGIDLGNYDLDDQALVLVNESFDVAQQFLTNAVVTVAPTESRLHLFADMLGKVIAHEAGHNLGASHTSSFDAPGIMDNVDYTHGVDESRKINARNIFGVGEDLIYGTADDVKVVFTSDGIYDPLAYNHGSINDSLNTVAFGLSTGTKAGTYFDFVTGTLYVTGTIDDGRKDTLEVRSAGSNLDVYINSALALTRPAADVTRVVLNGSSDRDTLIASYFSGPATLQGKAGQDNLFGSTGNDLLHGGDGNDLLLGRSGDDQLWGDAGNDILLGGDGDDDLDGGPGIDLLIGGLGTDHLYPGIGDDLRLSVSTAFDAYSVALSAILAEWNSAGGYETWMASLHGHDGNPRAKDR